MTRMKPLTIVRFSSTVQLLRIGKSVGLLGCCILLFGRAAYSADGTWLANPVDNNWYNPANWSSGTVPEGGDTAIFAFSNITDVNILAGAGLREIDFDVTAGAYTITASAGVGIGSDGAIQNNSGV
jgi:hypothetical protein